MKPTDTSPGSTIDAASVIYTNVNFTHYLAKPPLPFISNAHVNISMALKGQDIVVSGGHVAVTITASDLLHVGMTEAHGRLRLLCSNTLSRSAPIVCPPGGRAIRWFAHLFYSPETAERRVGQLLADLQREHRAAVGRGRRSWIVFKYWAAFLGIVV
jgi:hypothetical protein